MPFTFTITRDNTSEVVNPLTVNLAVSGTAVFGVDYTASGAASFTTTAASVVISANALSAAIVVTQISDAIQEPDKSVILTIVPQIGVSILGSNPAATATIIDDDLIDPYTANVVFFAQFTGANNSTTFTDAKGNTISIRSGTPRISTAQSIGGSGSLILDGSSSLSVAYTASFLSGTQDYNWEIALYPTAFTSGINQGLFDQRTSDANNNPEALYIANTSVVGTVAHFIGTTALALTRLKLNQWQVLSIRRYQGIKTILMDDIPVYSGADAASYTDAGNMVLGDILDTAGTFAGMFQGYFQYVRKTIGNSRRQGYNKFSLAINDTDPLEVNKIVDLSFDNGLIVDLKGNTITLGGTPTVSTTQKRSGSHSLALNGSQYLDLTVPSSNFGTNYTISIAAWLNAFGGGGQYTTPNLQYLFDCGAGGNTSAINWYAVDNNLAIVNAGANQAVRAGAATINTWYDIALIKIDTKYLLLFNNEIVAASNTAPASVDLSGSSIRVGQTKVANGNSGLTGYIDNFKIYKDIANGSNLTHSYPLRFLSRFSGSSPNDELGAVGTVVGTTHTYDTTNKRSLDTSALFAGAGHITYPAIAAYDFGAGGFEIAGWMIGTTPNATSSIIANGVASGAFDSQSWCVFNNDGSGSLSVSGKSTVNRLSFWVGAVNSGSAAMLASTTNVNDGQPHYWRIIKYIIGASAGTVLVVDGKIEDVYIGAYTIVSTTRPLVVGNVLNFAGRNFTGNLDDIAIYRA